MTDKKKKLGAGSTEINKNFLTSNYIEKIKSGQTDYAYWLELVFEDQNKDSFFLPASKEAKSLLLIYRAKNGLTRAEALERHFILCLTQHVAKIRHVWGLNIFTEHVGPKRYGRYHLLTPLVINVYKREAL